jgi:hypothetical protein
LIVLKEVGFVSVGNATGLPCFHFDFYNFEIHLHPDAYIEERTILQTLFLCFHGTVLEAQLL